MHTSLKIGGACLVCALGACREPQIRLVEEARRKQAFVRFFPFDIIRLCVLHTPWRLCTKCKLNMQDEFNLKKWQSDANAVEAVPPMPLKLISSQAVGYAIHTTSGIFVLKLHQPQDKGEIGIKFIWQAQ